MSDINKIKELKEKYNEILLLIINSDNLSTIKKFKDELTNERLQKIITKFITSLNENKKFMKIVSLAPEVL